MLLDKSNPNLAVINTTMFLPTHHILLRLAGTLLCDVPIQGPWLPEPSPAGIIITQSLWREGEDGVNCVPVLEAAAWQWCTSLPLTFHQPKQVSCPSLPQRGREE